MSRIHLRPRLQTLAGQVAYTKTAADIGCDHGKLGAALLQQGRVQHLFASDISLPSLEKARALFTQIGLEEHAEFYVSDGLSHLKPGQADVLLFAGMGGELIAELLEKGDSVARSAKKICMQPMGGLIELRRFLNAHNYRIVEAELVQDAGRVYQVLSAVNLPPLPPPEGFPEGEHAYSPLLFHKQDPLLLPLLRSSLASHKKRLEKAKARGKEPESLLEILNILEALIVWEENDEAE